MVLSKTQGLFYEKKSAGGTFHYCYITKRLPYIPSFADLFVFPTSSSPFHGIQIQTKLCGVVLKILFKNHFNCSFAADLKLGQGDEIYHKSGK